MALRLVVATVSWASCSPHLLLVERYKCLLLLVEDDSGLSVHEVVLVAVPSLEHSEPIKHLGLPGCANRVFLTPCLILGVGSHRPVLEVDFGDNILCDVVEGGLVSARITGE